MLTPLLGWLAAAFSMSLYWPQVWLSCVQGRTFGLSATACWLSAALNVTWLGYGLLLHDSVQLATNIVATLGSLAILGALVTTQPHLRSRRGLFASAWGATLLGCATGVAMLSSALGIAAPGTAGGVLGAVASAVGLVAGLPQPVSLLRDRDQDMSGLSLSRWMLSTAAAGLWFAYGLLQGQPAVWTAGLFSAGCGGVVVYAMLTWRRQAAAADGVVALPAVEPALLKLSVRDELALGA